MRDNASMGITTPEAVRAETEYLVGVGKDIAKAEGMPHIVEIGGRPYLFFNGRYERIEPIDLPAPAPMNTFSLSGLVDFIKADVDELFDVPAVRHIVRVVDVETVEVVSPLVGYKNARHLVARCKALVPQIPFDCYMDAEDFSIMVQTRFEQNENRDLVLKLAGSLREEQSMNTADDGFSQKVQISKGVATVGEVIVKNPVVLTPLRTFYEVDQPGSPFVLRFKEGASVALFEGDGGKWKLNAIENIKDWLKERLCGLNVEVIA
jgi:hypothetical protein